jgi:dolichyl-phosphooligosaccharide-protein glycotransferase
MNRYRTTFLIFSIFFLNLLLRLLPFHHVFTGGNIILLDGDSYYHMRRILLIALNFPHIPFYDYYMNFPDGAMSPWPPLYDLFVAAIAYLAGLGSPAARTVETVAAVMPPIFGALTVIPVYFFARRLFDEKIALWGTFFFSLVPGHIQYTYVGRPDHHAPSISVRPSAEPKSRSLICFTGEYFPITPATVRARTFKRKTR